MNVMLSMFRTIFFFPSAIKLFTFSRRALLSSPRTMRPSSATTDTPSTSRFVIFNATFVSSSSSSYSSSFGSGTGGNRAGPHSLSVIVRAGHVIAADWANQLASPRFQPLGADGTIQQSVLLVWRRGALLFPGPPAPILGSRARGTIGYFRRGGQAGVLCDPASVEFRRGFLRSSAGQPLARGTFHGSTVITHPPAREKRGGQQRIDGVKPFA